MIVVCTARSRTESLHGWVLCESVECAEKRSLKKLLLGGSFRWPIRFGSNACLDSKKKSLPISSIPGFDRLQARQHEERVVLFAPNRYVRDQVESLFWARINELMNQLGDPTSPLDVTLDIGSIANDPAPIRAESQKRGAVDLNRAFTFETFVEGKSNEIAKAAAQQVAENAGRSYNPLLLYGGVGLGKTHLMHAVGNQILNKDPDAKVVYLHSQRFVQDMVKALQMGTMQEFMQHYRSVDALLIDDIQFFANKLRSQEEFFHVFNALLERDHQMVLTCDRYPSEIGGLEERLKSRFVWGLTVEVEPPELETRVAILMKKAAIEGVDLPPDVAFFIAERVRSNVRELEGALKRVMANARFTGHRICIEQVQRSPPRSTGYPRPSGQHREHSEDCCRVLQDQNFRSAVETKQSHYCASTADGHVFGQGEHEPFATRDRRCVSAGATTRPCCMRAGRSPN